MLLSRRMTITRPDTSLPAATSAAPSFLERAKALLQRSSLVVVPLAAAVATPEAHAQTPGITVDYSVVGSQTSSGWFTDRIPLTESGVDGTATGTTAQLSGSRSITDGFFWVTDGSDTVPGYDTTGLRFMWGGQLQGAALSGDTLSSLLKFSLAFTHTPRFEGDQPTINYNAQLSYGSNPYTPAAYSNPAYSWDSYNTDGGSFSSAGTFEIEKTITTTFYSDWTGESALYWSLFVDVHWQNEFVSARNWTSGNYATLNGDTFAVTFGEGLTSVNFNSTAAAIPEPAHFAGIFGVIATGLLWWRRRRANVGA